MNDVPLSIRAAVALLEGQALKAYLCTGEPKSKRDLIRFSLGFGEITARGGTFRTYKPGVIRFIATEFDGELVISKPSIETYAPRHQDCLIGPLVFETKEELK